MNYQLPTHPKDIKHDHDVTGLYRTIRRGKHRRTPVSAKDSHGNPVIQVPLPDGSHAVVNDNDFFRLMDSGLTDQWLVNNNGSGTSYVRCMYQGRVITVARLIVTAPANSHVRTINGDPLDLRRSNLKVIKHKTRSDNYSG